MQEKIIDEQYLRSHTNEIFVFGDNTIRLGYGGAAMLRDEPNTYGFITKRLPDGKSSSYYTVEEYEPLYKEELALLRKEIESNPDKTYLISKVGAGLANKYGIYETVIEPNIKNDLSDLPNVEFLW